MSLQCEATSKETTALSSASIEHAPEPESLFPGEHLYCAANVHPAWLADHPECGVFLLVRSLALPGKGHFPERMPILTHFPRAHFLTNRLKVSEARAQSLGKVPDPWCFQRRGVMCIVNLYSP